MKKLKIEKINNKGVQKVETFISTLSNYSLSLMSLHVNSKYLLFKLIAYGLVTLKAKLALRYPKELTAPAVRINSNLHTLPSLILNVQMILF
ncbi:MAG: hypothetical protein JEZ09_12215 [Salinivirgaceae bacterium]|nr:hypothetical protein [Salinivirgaceae bacterium]